MIGKTAAFQRMASVLEPIYTLFEMGMAFVESFRATANLQDSVGNFITDWEAVLGRTQLTSITFRWRTVRAWKDRVVIADASRACHRKSCGRRRFRWRSLDPPLPIERSGRWAWRV